MTKEIQRPDDSGAGANSPALAKFSGWTKTDHSIFQQISAPKVSDHGGILNYNPLEPAAGANAANLKSGSEAGARGNIQQAAIIIEPCTPAGMDPLKDPANPNSPNYDAHKFGPRPAEKLPTIPQDGVINPDNPLHGMNLWSPEIGKYQGSCPVQKPKMDPSDIPMS